MFSKSRLLKALIVVALAVVGVLYCNFDKVSTIKRETTVIQTTSNENYHQLGDNILDLRNTNNQTIASRLPNPVYDNGVFILNNNKTDLDANVSSKAYVNNKTESIIHNGKHYNRPTVANAMLDSTSRQYLTRDKTTKPNSSWKPLGWHQLKTNDNYRYAVNKGHLIGYALAGKLSHWDASETNPKNVITQTAHANQSQDETERGQNYYEAIVRKALDQHKRVRYRVTAIYNNADDLVPVGTQLEAKSKDGSVEYNVFVPNAQIGLSIDYHTGEITKN